MRRPGAFCAWRGRRLGVTPHIRQSMLRVPPSSASAPSIKNRPGRPASEKVGGTLLSPLVFRRGVPPPILMLRCGPARSRRLSSKFPPAAERTHIPMAAGRPGISCLQVEIGYYFKPFQLRFCQVQGHFLRYPYKQVGERRDSVAFININCLQNLLNG